MKVTYQIQYLSEFGLWEDIPHKEVQSEIDLEEMKKLVKESSFGKYNLRVVKVTVEIMGHIK